MPKLIKEKTVLIMEIEGDLWEQLKVEAEGLNYFNKLGKFYFIRHEDEDKYPDISKVTINLDTSIQALLDLTSWDT